MKSHFKGRPSVISLLSVALLASKATSGDRPDRVQLEIGEPNVWSLEQAHYLLARLRAADEGLQNAPPTPADLDPNQIQATRLQLMQSMFNAEVSFDQTAAVKNQAAVQTFRADSERKQTLRSRLDKLNSDHLEVARQLTQLTLQAQTTTNKEAAAALSAEILSKTGEKTALESDIANTQSELSGLNIAQPALATVPLSTAPPLPSSVVSKLTQGTQPGVGAHRLQASTVLDNYIQMQYEIIAKQLTLLRDELGPYNRLVFLELPLSVYTTPTDSNSSLIEFHWRISGYYKRSRALGCISRLRQRREYETRHPASAEDTAADDPIAEDGVARCAMAQDAVAQGVPKDPMAQERRAQSAKALTKELIKLEQAHCFGPGVPPSETISDEQPPGPGTALSPLDRIEALERADCACELEDALAASDKAARRPDPEAKEQAPPYSQEDFAFYKRLGAALLAPGEFVGSLTDRVAHNGSANVVRVVDLIPRQSALNVNQTYDNVKGLSLGLHFLELFGLGGQVEYQRQKENYEQFVHQDMFASATGKGSTEFGWTFGPLPGSRQVAPGVKTTFAVLVLPADAVAVKLDAQAYSFSRKQLPAQGYTFGRTEFPDREKRNEKSFVVLVPPAEEGFYITAADYTPARPGDYLTMYLRGSYFSPQIGVLVNGVPLQKVVGIAQQRLNLQTQPTSDGTPIHGVFEQVNQQVLAISYTMGPTFQGTPTISVVTPEKASDIMYYRLCINKFGCPSDKLQTLFNYSRTEPMFVAPLALTSVKTVGYSSDKQGVVLLLSGTGFRLPRVYKGDNEGTDTCLSVNGRPLRPIGGANCASLLQPGEFCYLSSTSYVVNSKATSDATLSIAIAQTKGGITTEAPALSVGNPFRPQVNAVEIISDLPAAGGSKAMMQVRVQGGGFDLVSGQHLVSGGDGVVRTPVSPTEVVLTIVSPSEPITVVLDGPHSGEPPNGAVVSIRRPQPPHIGSILNPSTKNASGAKAGGFQVNIHGTNLAGVTDVLFNGVPGQIQGVPSDADLVVTAPAAPNAGAAFVALKTGLVYLGKKIDNAADQGSPNAFVSYTDK
jgi:hypothetical protein